MIVFDILTATVIAFNRLFQSYFIYIFKSFDNVNDKNYTIIRFFGK